MRLYTFLFLMLLVMPCYTYNMHITDDDFFDVLHTHVFYPLAEQAANNAYDEITRLQNEENNQLKNLTNENIYRNGHLTTFGQKKIQKHFVAFYKTLLPLRHVCRKWNTWCENITQKYVWLHESALECLLPPLGFLMTLKNEHARKEYNVLQRYLCAIRKS